MMLMTLFVVALSARHLLFHGCCLSA